MTVRVCSHRLSMQSDVLDDQQQQQISNDTDCSSTLSTTTRIYSGLKLVRIHRIFLLFHYSFVILASQTTCTNIINVEYAEFGIYC